MDDVVVLSGGSSIWVHKKAPVTNTNTIAIHAPQEERRRSAGSLRRSELFLSRSPIRIAPSIRWAPTAHVLNNKRLIRLFLMKEWSLAKLMKCVKPL